MAMRNSVSSFKSALFESHLNIVPQVFPHITDRTDFYQFLPRGIINGKSCSHKELPSLRIRTMTSRLP